MQLSVVIGLTWTACLLQGTFNNQRLVAPSANFHWKASWGGEEVFVAGDFTAWAVRCMFMPVQYGLRSCSFSLCPVQNSIAAEQSVQSVTGCISYGVL